MPLSPTNVPTFLQTLRSRVDVLKEKALSTRTSETETYRLKIRIQQLQEVIDFAEGKTSELA